MAKQNNNLNEQEMAEAYIYPHGLTAAEKTTADAELKTLRLQRLKQMSAEEKMYGNLLGLKYQMEDYLKRGAFSEKCSFGAFLKSYLQVLNKNPKEFAAEISLPLTTLNYLMEDKKDPSPELVFRLERHSGRVIPALLWWKLAARKVENNIQKDTLTRKKEAAKVKNELQFQF